ncbi:MAG: pilus assembly protein TadG-related protein, partial [Acidimicrobiia bacterium]
MIDLVKRAWKREDGVAMVWLATTIVLLLGTAGFAVDLGWMYLNSSRAQRAVDSAAMAGVVHLPGFISLAQSDAQAAAEANGYDFGTIPSPGPDSIAITPLSENELHVELQTSIPSFFLSVLGFDTFDITREATAEYIKPVPLGSPNRCFGQDPTGSYCTANINDFWGAVSGPYTRKSDGDPYSTHCLNNSSASSCSSGNIDYARAGAYNGYYYAIEVESGSSHVNVGIYDAGWDQRNNYPNVETADAKYSPGSGNPGLTT